MSSSPERRLWFSFREALLGFLDAIERYLTIEPRTAQIRKWWKETR